MDFYFSSTFQDYEVYKEFARTWELDFRKMDCSPFSAKLNLLNIGQVQVGKTRLYGKMDQFGLTPKGYRTFVIPANTGQNFLWYNKRATSKELLLFPEHGEVDGFSFDSFEVYTISIKKDYLHQIVESNQLLFCDKKIEVIEQAFSINPSFIQYINTYLDSIFNRLAKNSDMIHDESLRFGVEYRLPLMILGFIDKKEIVPMYTKGRKRDMALKSCVNFISEHIHSSIGLNDLTEVGNMSQRTIEYAFKERFGISPNNYIKNTKLNLVNQDLLSAGKNVLVNNLAEKYSFNHMGQFSADYTQLFGENPSKTLKRSRK